MTNTTQRVTELRSELETLDNAYVVADYTQTIKNLGLDIYKMTSEQVADMYNYVVERIYIIQTELKQYETYPA